jgi:hypothetical protein
MDTEPKGYIYALVASDEPLQIRYIGRTIKPKSRWSGTKLTVTSKEYLFRWQLSVKVRGAKVEMVILGQYKISSLPRAEMLWIKFWSKYCEVLNQKRYGMGFITQDNLLSTTFFH